MQDYSCGKPAVLADGSASPPAARARLIPVRLTSPTCSSESPALRWRQWVRGSSGSREWQLAIPPYAAYVADNWLATTRLTLNLGSGGMGSAHLRDKITASPTSIPTFTSRRMLRLETMVISHRIRKWLQRCQPGTWVQARSRRCRISVLLNGVGIRRKNAIPKGLATTPW